MEDKESLNWERIWHRLNNARLIRYLLLFALGWAIAQLLAYFEAIIVIFAFAAVLAFLLNFPVQWLQRFLPRSVAVVLVFLLSIFTLGILVFTVGAAVLSQGQELVQKSPELLNSGALILERLQNFLRQFNLQVDLSAIGEQIRDQAIAGVGIGLGTLQQMLFSLIDFILIAVVAFFMLLDGRRVWSFLIQAFPEHFQEKLTESVQKNFLGFFWGRFLLSLFFGVSCLVVFLLLDVPYALLLSTIAGLFDLIPGIGATIGVTLATLIVLPQGIWLSLTILVVCILLQQVEENLLMPRVMQGSIDMNPVILFLALLVGARVGGFLGLFLSIPVAGVIISVLDLHALRGSK